MVLKNKLSTFYTKFSQKKSFDIFQNILTISYPFSRFLTPKKSIFFYTKLSTFHIFIKNKQNICFDKNYVNRDNSHFFMWITWITSLITLFFPVFSCFSMWITFLQFLKFWYFFLDKKIRLCKLLILNFSSTTFIHTPYVENVDNWG